MRLASSGSPGTLIYYNSKIPVIYGTQNIPQGVQTLPSELDWNISALLCARTLFYSTLSSSHSTASPCLLSLSSHCPHSCHSVIITDRVDFFTSALCKSFILSPIHHHLSIYLGGCAICLSFPLLRLVRLVK